MDFPTRMENSYYYNEERQGGYYEEYYDPNQWGEYYYNDCSDYLYSAQDYCSKENIELCADMEEEPHSKWEDLLEKCKKIGKWPTSD